MITGHLRIPRYLAHTATCKTFSHPRALWRYLPVALQCWHERYQYLPSWHDLWESDDGSECALSSSAELGCWRSWWRFHYRSRVALASDECHSLWVFASSIEAERSKIQQQCIQIQQWKEIHSSASSKTNKQVIDQENDMCLMLTCDPPCHQHNQHPRIQPDQTLSPLDTIILELGCDPNIKEFASQLSDATPLVPLEIEHTCKH